MQAKPNHENPNPELVCLKAALFDEFRIMLEEAGQRATPEDAAIVISANLAYLMKKDNSELLTEITRNWEELVTLNNCGIDKSNTNLQQECA